MSWQIGNMDLGVAFKGDVSDLQRQLGAAGGEVEKFGRRTKKELDEAARSADNFGSSGERLAEAIKGAFVGGGVTAGLIFFKAKLVESVVAITEAQVQLDRLRNGFRFAVGERAAEQFSFVREEAHRLGLELGTTSQQYMKLLAATAAVGVPVEKTQRIFTGIAQISTTLGLGVEQVDRAFNAVIQSFSKGQVMAEEIRQQFGEHIPGAFEMAAQAMGISAAQLNKDMENGLIKPLEFWDRYATLLLDRTSGGLADASRSMQAELNRLESTWLKLKMSFADFGLGDAVKGQVTALTKEITIFSETIEAARQRGDGLGRGMADTLGAFVGRVSFGVAQDAVNSLNFSLKTLSGGLLGVNGQLDLMPDNLKPVSEQLAMNTVKVAEAQAKYTELQDRLAMDPGNVWIKSEMGRLAGYIERLRQAQDEQRRLLGQGGGGGPAGSVGSGDTALRRAEERATAARTAAERTAMDKFMTQFATPQEKLAAELAKQRELLGSLYSPEVEARIRAHFIKPTREAAGLTQEQREKEEELAEQLRRSAEVVELRNKAVQQAYEQEVKAAEEAVRAFADVVEDRQRAAAQAEENLVSQLRENDAIDLSSLALAHLQYERSMDAAAALERRAVIAEDIDFSGAMSDALRAEAQAMRELAGARLQGAQRKASDDAAQEAAKAWQKASDQIEDMLTDALMRGFESGKGFAENLGDSIVNMFKTWVAREIAKAITQAIMAALASARWGSAIGSLFGLGGAGGGMGNISTLSSIGGALYQFGTGASVGTSSAGLGYANMVGAFGGDSLGALYTANGGWAGVGVGGAAGGAGGAGGAAAGSGWMAAAGYAALIAAAIAIANNLYDKGYNRAALGMGGPQQQNFMNSSFMTDPRLGNSDIYNTSMERLNLSVLKGIGLSDKWADILSGTTRMATLFGRKLAGYGFDVGISGAGVNVGGYQFYKGGLFRSDKTRAVDIDAGDAEMIRQQVEAVRGSARGMAGAMGLSQEAIDAYTASLKINFKNAHTAEQQAQRLSEAMAGLHFEMLRAASGGRLTKDSFEKMMADVQASIEQAGISVEGMADIIMAGMLGRMDRAQVGQALAEQVLGGIYQTIASPFATQIAQAFQAQIITPVFTAIMAGVPISQAISQAAIQNVVATAQQAAATLNAILSDASFRQAIGDIQTALGGVAAASVQPAAQVRGLTGAVSSAGAAAAAARREWQSLARSLVEEIRRIRGEMLGTGPEGSANLEALFASRTAMARAGDKEAAGQLSGLSRDLIESYRNVAPSREDFLFQQAGVLASLESTAQLLARKYRFKLPAFADGGLHAGGWAMVGERGPELAHLPPARIYSAGETRQMLGGSQEIVGELRAMRSALAVTSTTIRRLEDGMAKLSGGYNELRARTRSADEVSA